MQVAPSGMASHRLLVIAGIGATSGIMGKNMETTIGYYRV